MKFEIDEDAVLRLNGAAMVALGASVVACPRAHADKAFTAAAKKDLLKVAGFGWLAASAASLNNLKNSHQPREVVYTSIATQTVLAGLSLWKGFETGDD